MLFDFEAGKIFLAAGFFNSVCDRQFQRAVSTGEFKTFFVSVNRKNIRLHSSEGTEFLDHIVNFIKMINISYCFGCIVGASVKKPDLKRDGVHLSSDCG